MAYKQPPQPLSIDDLGLQHWIDSGRGKQNGFGWKEFDLFCELNVPVTVIGRIYNKSGKTIKAWKAKRKEMQG